VVYICHRHHSRHQSSIIINNNNNGLTTVFRTSLLKRDVDDPTEQTIPFTVFELAHLAHILRMNSAITHNIHTSYFARQALK